MALLGDPAARADGVPADVGSHVDHLIAAAEQVQEQCRLERLPNPGSANSPRDELIRGLMDEKRKRLQAGRLGDDLFHCNSCYQRSWAPSASTDSRDSIL